MRLSKSDFKTARDCPAKLYYKKLRCPSNDDENPYPPYAGSGMAFCQSHPLVNHLRKFKS